MHNNVNYLQQACGSYTKIININDSLQLNFVLSVGDGIMLVSKFKSLL